MAKRNWTAALALECLKEAAGAAEYLQNSQQEIVNGNAVGIAEMVKANEDVDGAVFSTSWKIKANTTKFGKACIRMVAVAEAHAEIEAKQKSIPVDAVRVTKEIAAPIPA